MMELKFGECIGHKFTKDGTVRHFPGNTFICLLDNSSEVFRRVCAERDALSSSGASRCVSVLPDESLHMTAIEGVCDQVRRKEYWTSFLPLESSLEDVDDFFETKWKQAPVFPKVRMRFDHLWIESGVCISLYPDLYSDDAAIRDWRDEMSSLMGLRFPGHDRYRFHISLAYGIAMPDAEELKALEELKAGFDASCRSEGYSFEVPPASLTFFDDMFFFSKERISRS